jgi:photosystem II stability/assembly factor-like uncharacterized protein
MRILLAVVAVALSPSSLVAGPGRWTTNGPPERGIMSLAIAPSDPAVLYAVTATGRLFASANAGQSWEARSPLPVRGVLIHPSNPSLVYGYSMAQILRSTDAGRSWETISVFSEGVTALSSGIETLALAPSDPSVMYAGVGGNVFRSTDSGLSWSPTNLRAQFRETGTYALSVSPVSPSVVYAAAYVLDLVLLGDGLGVLVTRDGGVTWNAAHAEGVFPRLPFLTVRWIHVDPGRPQNVFAGGFGNEIYRSIDAGETFFPISLDPSVGVVTSLAVDPRSSLRVYAATASRGVLASDDGGFHFTPLNCLLPHLAMTHIVISPAGNALHVGTRWAGVFDYDMSSPPVAPLCPQQDVVACLQAGRFCVGITRGIGPDRLPLRASAVTLTPDTAAFWFFDPSNLEVMLKVLDGTRINGKFWVFYGSLSNVEYEITVTDNETGRTRTYRNNQGQATSVTDTEAF